MRVEDSHAEVLHLGTAPAHTRQGHARALLLAVAGSLQVSELTAETDDDALEFYRRAGFTVTAVEARDGRARYLCRLSPAE